MKKTLALLLSAVLLLTTVLAVIPFVATAVSSPIEATPLVFNGYNNNFIQECNTAAEVTPAWFTNAKGRKLTLKEGNSGFSESGGLVTNYHPMTFNLYNKIGTTGTHLMFYVELDGPETIALWFTEQDNGYVFHLKNEGSVEILSENGSKWETKALVNSGDSPDGNFGTGAIEFTEAFKGLVKVPYEMIGTGESTTLSPTMTVKQMLFCLKGLGTSQGYTSYVTLGPVLNVTANSTSTEIEVPDAFRLDPEPLEATPLIYSNQNQWSLDSYTVGEDVIPLDYTVAEGRRRKLSQGKKFQVTGGIISSTTVYGERSILARSYDIPTTETHFMFYFEADGPMTIYPRLQGYDYAADNMFLRNGCTVQVLEEGSSVWTDKATVDSGDSTGADFGRSAIQFNKAFKGYIKIAYTDIGNDTNGAVNSNPSRTYAIRTVEIFVKGMGTEYGYANEFIFGPFFAVTTPNATKLATDIIVPEAYRPAPEPEEPEGPKAEPGILPSNVVPLEIKSAATGISVELTDAEALPFTSAVGKNLKLYTGTDFYNVNDNGRGSAGVVFTLKDSTKINKDDNHFIFRIETDGPLTFTPMMPLHMGTKDEWWHYLADGATVLLLEDGETEWKELKTVNFTTAKDNKPQIVLDRTFRGYIKIAYDSFDGQGGISTMNSVDVTRIDFYIHGMGEIDEHDNAENVVLGPFFTVCEELPPEYLAENVWDKSVLPEMVPFEPFTELIGYDWAGITVKQIQSPIPSLTSNKGFFISHKDGIDLSNADVLSSPHAGYSTYDYMALGDITHIMIYIKVPETKENHLAMSIWTGKDSNKIEFKIMKNSLYALLPLGETEWQHYYTTNAASGNWGAFTLPAGFEGFLKIPLTTLQPNRANAKTEVYSIGYRFSYLGSDTEKALVGPVFGVTKDNDPGPAEVVLTAPPTATTILRPYIIEDGDIFPDKVMLSWQPYDGAKEYLVDAYLVQKDENGNKTYKLIKSVRAFTNSATVTGLEKDTQYALVVNAVDGNRKIFATYDYILVSTSSENMYTALNGGGQIPLDGVIYPFAEGTEVDSMAEDSMPWVIIAICVGGALILTGVAVAAVLVIKKRRKTNA